MRLILKRRSGANNSAECAEAVRAAIGGLHATHREALRLSSLASGLKVELDSLTRDTPGWQESKGGTPLDGYYFVDGIPAEAAGELVERLSLPALFAVCRLDRAIGSQKRPLPVSARTNQPIPQHYLKEAPIGVDSFFSKLQSGGDGESISVVVIANGFHLVHPDLPSVTILYGTADTGPDPERCFGTALLGVLCSIDDGCGTVGLVPKAAAGVAAIGQAESEIATALIAGAARVKRGSVLLLATQTEDRLPSETNELIFDAIQLVVAARRVVVAAAGDGGINFDSYADAFGRQVLNPSSDDFRYSGAILVAGCQDDKRLRSGTSNFGSRVDCFGWSDAVGATYPPDGYAAASGTAAAAAIVTGCAVSLQGMHRCRTAKVLDPPELRNLLVRSGTHPLRSQDRIGTMPDLRQAFRDIG